MRFLTETLEIEFLNERQQQVDIQIDGTRLDNVVRSVYNQPQAPQTAQQKKQQRKERKKSRVLQRQQEKQQEHEKETAQYQAQTAEGFKTPERLKSTDTII